MTALKFDALWAIVAFDFWRHTNTLTYLLTYLVIEAENN